MNLLLSSQAFIVWTVCAVFRSDGKTDIPACNPANTDIDIDAQVPSEILTPAFPDNYPDSSCIWKIHAPERLRLKLTIAVLKLDGADDYIVIRDGEGEFSPLIGKYGPCASGTLTLFSSGRSAFIQMSVATYSGNNRLRIAYRPTNPDNIDCSNQGESLPNYCATSNKLTEPSGVIASPNFPSNYGSDENCEWAIVAPRGYRVQFTIRWFGIEQGNCLDDSIYISHDIGNNTEIVAVLCGCERLFTFDSSRERIWVMFLSYATSNWPGFYATYRAVSPEECSPDAKTCRRPKMAPIGFNAQGQLCTDLEMASSQVPSLLGTSTPSPASVKSPFRDRVLTSSLAAKLTSSPHPTIYEKTKALQAMTATPFIKANTPATPVTPGRETNMGNATPTLSSSIAKRDENNPHSSKNIFTSVEAVKSIEVKSHNSNPFTKTVTPSTPVTAKNNITNVGTATPTFSSTSIAKRGENNEHSSKSIFTSLEAVKSIEVKSHNSNPFIKTNTPGTPVTPEPNETNMGTATPTSFSSSIAKRDESNQHWSKSHNSKSSPRSQIQKEQITSVNNSLKIREDWSPVPGMSLTFIRTSTLTNEKRTSVLPAELRTPSKASSMRATSIATSVLKTSNARYSTSSMENTKLLNSHIVAKETKAVKPVGSRTRSDQLNLTSQRHDVNPSQTTEIIHNSPTSDPSSGGSGQILVPSKGIAVKCTQDLMEISIKKALHPNLDPYSLHLLDPSCRLYSSNDTHALLRAPLEGCGTTHSDLKDYFVYSNTVLGESKSSNSSSLITREGRVKIDFQCSFKRLHVISIVSYSPRRKKFYTSDDGLGNFTYEMDMFKDPQYDIAVQQYPVIVYPGQPMYFQVDVQSRDRSLLIFLDECWVTPTSNPRDSTKNTVIKNGCPRDSTLRHFYEKSPTQKFTFAAFRFVNVPSPRLFVHCEVITCRRSDSGSVCDKGCTEKRRPKREPLVLFLNEEVSLSLGPINIKRASKAVTVPSESTWYVTALAGLLGALAVFLLAAIVLLVLRRRRQAGRTWILIAKKDPLYAGSKRSR